MTISATEFKAKCLELLDRVYETGERIQVTKWGKVVAELGPVAGSRVESAKAGFAREEIAIYGDEIEPVGGDWEALS